MDRLAELLERLVRVAPEVRITHGTHTYREGCEPHYAWEVIAAPSQGMCYPPFSQADDLEAALNGVLEQVEPGPKKDEWDAMMGVYSSFMLR